MATWGEIKLAALKKMDPSIQSLAISRTTKDYLNAIVPAANRGLQDLATAGKFMAKSHSIMLPDMENMLDEDHTAKQHINSDMIYGPEKAKSYYFEVSGKAEILIMLGGAVYKAIRNTEEGYHVYKGIVNNPADEEVTIVFTGKYPYLYRNVALFDIEFEEDADVWEWNDKRRFELKKIIPDFYRLISDDVVLESNENAYLKFKGYEWETDDTIIIDGTRQGIYTIHYYAYPQEITDDTSDDMVMSLDPEVAALLPVFIAAELYEDDDSSQAYYFRQQYQESKQTLMQTVTTGKAQFEDIWGW